MSLEQGILFGVAAMVGWGLQDFVMATSSKRIGHIKTVVWWTWLQTAFMVALFAVGLVPVPYSSLSPAILAAIAIAGVSSVLASVSYAKGLEIGNVSIVAAVGSTWGAVTALLGIFALGETIAPAQAAAVAIVILGAVLASGDLVHTFVKRDFSRLEKGLPYAVGAVAGWGLFFFIDGYLSSALGWLGAALVITIPTFLAASAFALASKEGIGVDRRGAPAIIAVAALGLLGLFAYNMGVTKGYIAIVAPVSAATPAVTVILALTLLNERIVDNQKLGILLVMAGIVLLSL